MATFWQHLFEKNHKNNKILKDLLYNGNILHRNIEKKLLIGGVYFDTGKRCY